MVNVVHFKLDKCEFLVTVFKKINLERGRLLLFI